MKAASSQPLRAARSKQRSTKPSRPKVIVNFAITWDGKISTRNLTPATFSSKGDKRRLVEIRAQADALLVGKGTLEKDDMPMGLPSEALRQQRVARGQTAYPMRVVLSNSGRIKTSLKIFQRDFSPILIFSTTRMPQALRDELSPRATLHLTAGDAVDLRAMLAELRKTYRVKKLVCEGGAEVFRSLLALDLVDEIYITLCPAIFGGEKAPTLTGLAGAFLPQTISCKLVKMEVADGECFLRYKVVR